MMISYRLINRENKSTRMMIKRMTYKMMTKTLKMMILMTKKELLQRRMLSLTLLLKEDSSAERVILSLVSLKIKIKVEMIKSLISKVTNHTIKEESRTKVESHITKVENHTKEENHTKAENRISIRTTTTRVEIVMVAIETVETEMVEIETVGSISITITNSKMEEKDEGLYECLDSIFLISEIYLNYPNFLFKGSLY